VAAISASYDEEVSNTPTGEPEPQWRQPSFPSDNDPKAAPAEGPVASGSVLVPRGAVPPPTVMETTIATVGGVVWPVMIVLALMGAVPWWPAILIAIVTSTVLGNVRRHMKAQRKALGRGGTIPPGGTTTPASRNRLR
jgi:hypothetical protein